MRELVVIACNYIVDTSAVAAGARAYVHGDNPGNGNDRIRVLVRSRGSRWIVKWESTDRLGRFRAVTVVEDARIVWDRLHDWPLDRDETNELARLLAARSAPEARGS